MPVEIVQGEHGLFYGTDTAFPAVFVAAKTEPETRRFVEEAGNGLLEGTVVVPSAKDQTPAQRKETVDRLKKHLHKDTN